VEVQSHLGAGTRFSVRLPGAVRADESVLAASPPPPLMSLRGRCIYVVDDEQDILKSMTRLLQLWEAQPYGAQSIAAALQLFEEHGKPDLMITDLRLGGQEHGAQLALRLQRSFGTFPTLIITGEISSEALNFADEAGFELLHKPITEESLRRAMNDLLTRPPSAVVGEVAVH